VLARFGTHPVGRPVLVPARDAAIHLPARPLALHRSLARKLTRFASVPGELCTDEDSSAPIVDRPSPRTLADRAGYRAPFMADPAPSSGRSAYDRLLARMTFSEI